MIYVDETGNIDLGWNAVVSSVLNKLYDDSPSQDEGEGLLNNLQVR